MTSSTWKHTLLMVPAVGASLLPRLICPMCWPAYAGIVSSLGLGFLIGTAYLLPVTAAFLVVSTGALAFRARQRRGYAPFWTGSGATMVVLVGKFRFDSVVATYAGHHAAGGRVHLEYLAAPGYPSDPPIGCRAEDKLDQPTVKGAEREAQDRNL